MVVIVLMVMMIVVMVLVDNDMFGDGSFVSGALGNSALLLTKVNGFPDMRKNVMMIMIMTIIDFGSDDKDDSAPAKISILVTTILTTRVFDNKS